MPDTEATDRGARAATSLRPFQIRGRFLTAIALRLEGPADREMLAALDARLSQTPRFFADAPMVIDLEQAAGQVTSEDLSDLVGHLRYRKVSVFAVQGGSREQKAAAANLGLISIPAGGDVPPKEAEQAPAPLSARAAGPGNRLVAAPVRSGQTVAAESGDLIVVGPVSSGAELVAAGNIHVYGQLRGRAFAGVFGDESARIFCQGLDAELLSIAGLYRMSESLDRLAPRQNVQILLRGDRLCVEPLGQARNPDRSGQ